MSIGKKQSIPQTKLPINDLPQDHFPDLPQSMRSRFPESDTWIKTVQDRFRILQQRLWERESELEIWKRTIENSISTIEATPGPSGPSGPSGPTGP